MNLRDVRPILTAHRDMVISTEKKGLLQGAEDESMLHALAFLCIKEGVTSDEYRWADALV